MAEKPEDLNLPVAVVTRIIKEAIPENCNISKDAKLALAKAASVFVLYLTSYANNIAIANSRKTINKKDVLSAVQEIDFGKFEEPLLAAAELFQKLKQNKIMRQKQDTHDRSSEDILTENQDNDVDIVENLL